MNSYYVAWLCRRATDLLPPLPGDRPCVVSIAPEPGGDWQVLCDRKPIRTMPEEAVEPFLEGMTAAARVVQVVQGIPQEVA